MPKVSKKKTSLLKSLQLHQAKAESAAKAGARRGAVLTGTIPKIYKTASSGSTRKDNALSRTLTPSSQNKGNGRPVVPFLPGRRILLVGEGNFSFSLSLLTTESVPTTPQLLIATSYDSEQICFGKYPEAQDIVSRIRALGATVCFDVDATKLHKHKRLRKLVYDTVAFNFPHVGAGIKDQDRNIVSNQRLIIDFLQSAATLLAKGKDPRSLPGSSRKKRKRNDEDTDDEEDADGGSQDSDVEDSVACDAAEEESATFRRPPPTRGTVLITLRDAAPYNLWDITRLAKDPPMEKGSGLPPHRYNTVRSFVFRPGAYGGYEHRRTIGGSTGLTANEDLFKGEGVCRTWEFAIRDSENS